MNYFTASINFFLAFFNGVVLVGAMQREPRLIDLVTVAIVIVFTALFIRNIHLIAKG